MHPGRRREEVCVTTDGGIDYFDISVSLAPQGGTGEYDLADSKNFLGNAINLLLLDYYGVGDAGSDDGIVLVAGVCADLTTTTRARRELAYTSSTGYVWRGGAGACRCCRYDNSDRGRRMVVTSEWFENTFKPYMEATLVNDLAPFRQGCLGTNPIAFRISIYVVLRVVRFRSWRRFLISNRLFVSIMIIAASA
jgi:hypothetical protein